MRTEPLLPDDPIRPTLGGRPTPVVLVVAALVLLVAELGARAIAPRIPVPLEWPTIEMQGKFQQIDDLAGDGSEVDLVFLGSSVAFEDVDPVAFNEAAGGVVTAYNAGIPAALADSSLLWGLDVVIPRLEPETVVIALTSLAVNDGTEDDFLDRFVDSRGYRRSGPGPADSMDRLAQAVEDRVALFRIRGTLREPLTVARALLGLDTGDDSGGDIGPFGQEPAGREDPTFELSPELERRIRNSQLADFAVGGTQMEQLRALIDGLQDQQIDVILVSVPVTEVFLTLHPDGPADFAEFEGALAALAADEGIPLLDFSDAYDSVEWFRDPSHLNPAGAAHFSRRLAEEVLPLIASR